MRAILLIAILAAMASTVLAGKATIYPNRVCINETSTVTFTPNTCNQGLGGSYIVLCAADKLQLFKYTENNCAQTSGTTVDFYNGTAPNTCIVSSYPQVQGSVKIDCTGAASQLAVSSLLLVALAYAAQRIQKLL